MTTSSIIENKPADRTLSLVCDVQGIKFEPDSFKLSHEMIVLMGGPESPGYRAFVDLTIKAFLACRQYAHQVVQATSQMLAAEFPSFKGEATMDRLLERFRLELSEQDAAKYMMTVIDNAYENRMSIVYDHFQKVTNGKLAFPTCSAENKTNPTSHAGIPYTR